MYIYIYINIYIYREREREQYICIWNTYMYIHMLYWNRNTGENILDNLEYGCLGVQSWCIVLGEWVRMEEGKGLIIK